MLDGCLKSFRSTRPVAISLLLLQLLAAAAYLRAETAGADIKNPPAARPQAETSVIHVYFADKKGAFLLSEERVITGAHNPIELGKRIMEALLQGPWTDLMQTIPTGTQLRALFLTADGTAYVDLTETVTEKHPGGCRAYLHLRSPENTDAIVGLPDSLKLKAGGALAREVNELMGYNAVETQCIAAKASNYRNNYR